MKFGFIAAIVLSSATSQWFLTENEKMHSSYFDKPIVQIETSSFGSESISVDAGAHYEMFNAYFCFLSAHYRLLPAH